MDALFLPLANMVGASVDQIKLISCLLVAYPLGSLFIRMPTTSPTLRHLFSIAIALFFFFPILKMYSAFFQLLASVIGTYVIARLNHSSRMPWIVFVFVMGHLTINHVVRAMYQLSYETMEVTGPQMVLTMKLTTFAWNVWDGRRPVAELDKWQTEKRIVNYPSLIEFLGYAFYFPGILVGPYLDLAEYRALISGAPFQDTKVREKIAPGRRLPSHRKRAAYTKLAMGLVYLGIFVALGGSNNFSTALTPWFAQHDLYVRITLFQLYGFLERCKYYAIWTLTEGASILTGLGFTGFSPSGEPLWEGAANVRVLQIEFPSSFKILLDSWNMKTNVWLRECVYKRITPKGKKPGFMSSMVTFLTSAFWHGIAGGYYLTFLLGGFITTAARLARSNIRPLLSPPPGEPESVTKELYDIAGTLLSTLLVNYTAAPFMLLSLKKSLIVWGRLGFYGHIVIFGALLFFYGGGTKYLKNIQIRRGGEKGQASGTSTPASEKNFIIPPSLDQVVLPRK